MSVEAFRASVLGGAVGHERRHAVTQAQGGRGWRMMKGSGCSGSGPR